MVGDMNMSLMMVDESNFEQEVLLSELPVMVDFMASWCGPCKQMAPEFDALAAELKGRAKLVKVDIDQSRTLASQLRIQSVPTTMVFAAGRLVNGKVGALRKAQLRELIEPFLPRTKGALTALEAAQLLQQRQIVFVDTRDEAVFNRMHLPGAVNMPLDTVPTRLAELHMLAGVPVLYCRTGDKAKELSETLGNDGIDVAFLEGGVLGWEGEGLPVERPE